MTKTYDEKDIKIKAWSIPYRIFLVLEHKKMHTKQQICKMTGLSKGAVNRGCRILRKQKMLFWFKRKWWGTR